MDQCIPARGRDWTLRTLPTLFMVYNSRVEKKCVWEAILQTKSRQNKRQRTDIKGIPSHLQPLCWTVMRCWEAGGLGLRSSASGPLLVSPEGAGNGKVKKDKENVVLPVKLLSWLLTLVALRLSQCYWDGALWSEECWGEPAATAGHDCRRVVSEASSSHHASSQSTDSLNPADRCTISSFVLEIITVND